MPARSTGNNALIFLLITILVDTIGFGIMIPVMPELLMELTGEDLSGAAIYSGWLIFLYAGIQFIAAPVLGNLSDRYGRRPILLLSLAAFGVDYVFMGLAPTIVWLFVGRAFSGVFGATYSVANAYIADITPPEKRAANFGLLGAAWGLGFISGPILGGLLGAYGPRVPFFAASALALANVIYGFFVLPEALAPENRREFNLKRANPIGALVQMRKYPAIFGFFGVIALYQIAHDANPAVFSFSMMEKFAWTEREVGLALGCVGVCGIFVQAFLIRAIIPRIGEANSVYFGMTCFALGFIGFAFATEGWMVYAFIALLSLGGLASPSLRSIMSRQVPADAQGELQGAIMSIMSLSAIAAPIIMTRLFFYFSADTAPTYFPGAPFLAAAILMFSALGICVVVFTRNGKRPVAEAAAEN